MKFSLFATAVSIFAIAGQSDAFKLPNYYDVMEQLELLDA